MDTPSKRMNHSKNPRMEQCVAAWDTYTNGGGILCLKDFWKQEKYADRFGIVYNTFYDYARIGKEKRTPLYSQVGPTPSWGQKISAESASISTTATEEDELDEEAARFMGRSDLYDYLVDERRTIAELGAAARRGHGDPVLVEFELWHLRRECKRLEGWLKYYGYANCFVHMAILNFINKLADKMRHLKHPNKRRAQPCYTYMGGSAFSPPPFNMGSDVWQRLAAADQHAEMVMTGGGWNA